MPHRDPIWAIVSSYCEPHKGRHYYHIARVVRVDGEWFELYWHPFEHDTRGQNKSAIRKAAKVKLAPGIFYQAPSPRNGSTLTYWPSHA